VEFSSGDAASMHPNKLWIVAQQLSLGDCRFRKEVPGGKLIAFDLLPESFLPSRFGEGGW
jgi:hypothetical protein